MRIFEQGGRLISPAIGGAWSNQSLGGADDIGVGRDARKPGGCRQIAIGPDAPRRLAVVRSTGRVNQLNQRQIGQSPQRLEGSDFERLNEYALPLVGKSVGPQGFDQ